MVTRDWIKTYDERPADLERVVVSWDTASTIEETSDWLVGTVWGMRGIDFYLLDVVRGKYEAPNCAV
jgi:phage terminase large subunit-like protein